jgi:hypothetical protein
MTDLTALAAMAGGAILALALAMWRMFKRGEASATARRAARDAADYSKERRRIDETDLGAGATDVDRIRRLQSIADKRGS